MRSVPEHAVSTSSPLFPLLWALKSAPVADTAERLVLVALAETALSDGTRACRSRAQIAEVALVDEKTVQRRTSALLKRGLIVEGNQQALAHLPANSRPKVYDIQIPYVAFPAVDLINAERAQRGEPPLTPELRPELEAAPDRRRRKDAGMILGPQRQRTGISDALRQFVYERDGYRCLRCGATEDLTLDHIHPWVLGGTNSVENLQTLCRPCNSRKNATVGGSEVTS